MRQQHPDWRRSGAHPGRGRDRAGDAERLEPAARIPRAARLAHGDQARAGLSTGRGLRGSVVIPVWNQERYVAECVESALGQSYADREVVVVDDGSTDETPARLAGFGERICTIRQENAGFAAALNNGIRRS